MFIYYINNQERSNSYLVQRTIKATYYLDLSGLVAVCLLFLFTIVERLPNATFVQLFHLHYLYCQGHSNIPLHCLCSCVDSLLARWTFGLYPHGFLHEINTQVAG